MKNLECIAKYSEFTKVYKLFTIKTKIGSLKMEIQIVNVSVFGPGISQNAMLFEKFCFFLFQKYIFLY
jgi:hypothetical protein